MPLSISVISIVVAVANIALAVLAFSHRDKASVYLGAVLATAALVDITYTASIMAGDDLALMSWWSSVYFSGVTLLCLFLAGYASYFTEHELSRRIHGIAAAAFAIAIVDVCQLMANPFTGHAISYLPVSDAVVHWVYVPHFAYCLHLLFTYALLAFVVSSLGAKIRTSPRVYKRRYLVPLAALVIIIAANAVFLFVREAKLLDFSVYLYGFAGVIFYVSHYYYAKSLVTTDSYKMALDELENIVVFFDYNQHFLSCNDHASLLIEPEYQNDTYTLQKFKKRYHLEEYLGVHSTPASDVRFIWNMPVNGKSTPCHCLLKTLYEQGKLAGYLFVCADSSLEIDPLTGFHTKAAFERDFDEAQARPSMASEAANALSASQTSNLQAPSKVVAFDINGLGRINSLEGYEAGNEALQTLSKCLTAAFPKSTYFVRLDDGQLLAICENMDKKQADLLVSKVIERLNTINAEHRNTAPYGVQYATCAVEPGSQTVQDAVRIALRSMSNRKLLDPHSSHASLLSSLVQAQRQNDGETEEHVARTRLAGELLAQRLHLSDLQQSSLSLLCLMHDVGKIGVPLEILNKPNKLNDAEWRVMMSHSQKGYEIASTSPELKDIATLILHHHERWDGHGYPLGLAGENIPLLSRIIAIVDAYDAMTHDRPYRKAVSTDQAKAELERCAGTQFDPNLVKAFLETLDENPHIAHSDATDRNVHNLLFSDGAEGCDGGSKGAGGTAEFRSGAANTCSIRDNGTSGTEEPLSEERLQEAQRAHAVSHARYFLDENECIVRIDAGFTQLTGYTEEDVRRCALKQFDLIPAEDHCWYTALIEKEVSADGEAFLKHRILRKDGEMLTVLCFGRRYFDAAERAMLNEIVVTKLS